MATEDTLGKKILAFVLHQIVYAFEVVEGKKTVRKEVKVEPGTVHAFPADVHADVKAQGAVRAPNETELALHKMANPDADVTADTSPDTKKEPIISLPNGSTQGTAAPAAGQPDDESL